MSVVNCAEATCKKCGTKNRFMYYASWFSINGEHAPQIENICRKCNSRLNSSDITDEYAYVKNYKLDLWGILNETQ